MQKCSICGKYFEEWGKHSIKTSDEKMLDKVKNLTKENSFYSQTVARQGERLVFLENKVKKLENQLVQERADRIEDLKTVNFIATSNTYNNEKISLRKVAELTGDKLKNITNGIIDPKIKELNSRTDQSI